VIISICNYILLLRRERIDPCLLIDLIKNHSNERIYILHSNKHWSIYFRFHLIPHEQIITMASTNLMAHKQVQAKKEPASEAGVGRAPTVDFSHPVLFRSLRVRLWIEAK
jgi:hypothetical protein